jgi:hypothetical protein
VKAWLPPGPKRTLPKARAATWAAQVKRPQSNFATAFEGKAVNYKWGLVAPTKKEQGNE